MGQGGGRRSRIIRRDKDSVSLYMMKTLTTAALVTAFVRWRVAHSQT